MTDAVSRRIDRLLVRAEGTSDGIFDALASVLAGSSALPFPIGLLVDGALIHGALAPPEATADAVDAAMRTFFTRLWPGRPYDEGDMGTAFRDIVNTHQERMVKDREVVEKYSDAASIDDWADEDVRPILRATAHLAHVDIRDARIRIGDTWANIGVMRVNTAHISAWWPLEQEEGVQINYVSTAEDDN